MDKVTTDQFVLRAKAKHGPKYDYSRVVVNGMNRKVTIGCPTHGYFRQSPSHHLKGGCRHCGQIEARKTQSRTIRANPNYRDREKRLQHFLARVKKKHGNRYDYSKVVFINTFTKVEVVCSTHGSFFVTPENHYNSGCPACAEETRSERSGTKAERLRKFIAKARKVHGRRYSYTEVCYINARASVLIICRKHGGFIQTPWSHGAGHGCPICSRDVDPKQKARRAIQTFLSAATSKHRDRFGYEGVTENNIYGRLPIECPQHGTQRLTRKQHLEHGCPKCRDESIRTEKKTAFLAAATAKYGDKYDYSAMRFRDMTTKVTINCNMHGRFRQEPWRHLQSVAGCLKCGWQSTGSSLSLTQDQFKAKVASVFGNELDLSKVKYTNNRTRVTVGCRKHGDFQIPPEKLMAGKGCQTCAIESRNDKLRMSLDEFRSKAVIVHGDRYDYSDSYYDPDSGKWLVSCKSHGPWLVSSSNHISRASGCPKCPVSIGHEFIRAVLIDHGIQFEEEKRFKGLPGYRFDFSVTDDQLLIEYDGIQHFQAVDLFGGPEALTKTRKRDRKKNDWARLNGYRLLRIRFDMPDTEIRSSIAEALRTRVARSRTLSHPRRILKRQRRKARK
jgi:very-short-patch-repair endonuclease